MSRKPREQSASGIYHIMLRGINRQNIFEDDEDRKKFLQVIQDCKAVSRFKLYTYCLMSNHVHLLLGVDQSGESLDVIFKRIGVRFVAWYNRKYDRSGHLFQDRFRSEAVNDDAYFITVLTYIHQNPVKAGLCESPERYPWSGYHEYLSQGGICSTYEALNILDADPRRGLELLKMRHRELLETVCLDIGNAAIPSDQVVREYLMELCKTDQVSALQRLPAAQRDAAIAELKGRGASLRQIVRLTGWSFGIVRSR